MQRSFRSRHVRQVCLKRFFQASQPRLFIRIATRQVDS